MTRHELKEQIQHDQFTDSVQSAVDYISANREKVTRWAIAALVVLAIVGGAFWFASYRRSLRQHDLQGAFAVLDAPVGEAAAAGLKSYPTQDAKTKASMKAFSDVVAKDGSSREGLIARYYLGTLKAQSGDSKGAETDLTAVAASHSECAPLAKIALAQLYQSENRITEAQNLLQQLVTKPADLVSKGQAQVLLAQLMGSTNPEEARKMLQSLKGSGHDPAVTRAVDQLSAELSK